jgi:PelA/Pel-15E family pectate lyase
MKRGKLLLLIIAVILTLVLAACDGDSDTPEPTAAAVPTESPAPTEAPYATPDPTPDPVPTAAPAPEWEFPIIEWENNFQRTVITDGQAQMLVNNRLVDVDGGTPTLRDDVLYVPLAAARRAAGQQVEWTVDGTEVTATRGTVTEKTIAVDIGGGLFIAPHTIPNQITQTAWDPQTGTLIITVGATNTDATVVYRDINTRPEAWYGSQASINIANNLLLMQRANGGWPRGIGQDNNGQQPWEHNNIGRVLNATQLARLDATRSTTDAYFGRGITTHETRFMLRIYEATRIEAYRVSGERGLDAIFGAQMTTGNAQGGWRYRVAPDSGYQGDVSINDDSYTTIMELLLDIMNGDFPQLDEARTARSEQAFNDGLDAILRLQIPSSAFADGQERLTAWGQQMHRSTGIPVWGREFEPPSISGWESVDLLFFLMSLPDPCERLQHAIHSAVYFFAYAEIFGYRHVTGQPSTVNPAWGNDRTLVADSNARGLWGRFICIQTFEPLFSDRRTPNWRTNEVTDAAGRLGQLYPSPGGRLRNVYRNAAGELLPAVSIVMHAGHTHYVNRPEDAEFDIIASYAGLSHERRNGYQYVGGYGNNIPGRYASWLRVNNLTSPN